MGGGSYDRRTAINSAKKSENEEGGEQGRDGYNSCGQRKCKKGGWFSLLRHKKSGEGKRKQRGTQGRGV